ncbi:MAG: hypothetical protein MUF45_14650 [Spirosomaceae bacterium]|jgi:hypothetical protein|nr:hypothetical protein [Spirosomataceae bacterium]
MFNLKTIVALVVAAPAFAQVENVNIRNAQLVDPGLSVHNYKHPNKAAFAKKYQLDKGLNLSIPKGESNYKPQNKLVATKVRPPFNLSDRLIKRLRKEESVVEIKQREPDFESGN